MMLKTEASSYIFDFLCVPPFSTYPLLAHSGTGLSVFFLFPDTILGEVPLVSLLRNGNMPFCHLSLLAVM